MAKSVVRVDGLRELGEAMRSLGREVATKVATSMTSAAAGVVRKDAIARAPEHDEPHTVDGVEVQPGNLKRNIVRKKVAKSKTPLTSVHIVTVRGKRKDGYAARYGRLQEFGTVHHAPQPFLRPAFDNNRMRAVDEMKRVGQRRIEAAAKKAAKR